MGPVAIGAPSGRDGAGLPTRRPTGGIETVEPCGAENDAGKDWATTRQADEFDVLVRGGSSVASLREQQGAIISANSSSKPLVSTHQHTDVDECQEEVEDLRSALETRPVIDQAKGILIGQHHCTPDEAFAMLAEASQRSNRKLRDVAQAIVQAESETDA